MRQTKSKLICKCGKRGGVLTLRQAGNSRTKNALYIQHYDPTRNAGKRPCYISKQNIALIELNDERYHKEYKPLIEEYANRLKNDSPSTDYEMDVIAQPALLLLLYMRWPNHVVSIKDKFFADVDEVTVLEFVKRYKDSYGVNITREQAFKLLSKKSRFKMTQDEKKWWKEVAERGRKILRGQGNNDS